MEFLGEYNQRDMKVSTLNTDGLVWQRWSITWRDAKLEVLMLQAVTSSSHFLIEKQK